MNGDYYRQYNLIYRHTLRPKALQNIISFLIRPTCLDFSMAIVLLCLSASSTACFMTDLVYYKVHIERSRCHLKTTVYTLYHIVNYREIVYPI